MFLTLHQKFAHMSPTLFRSRRRPSHGRRPRRRCVRASPRLPADQSLRRAPARSGTLCLSRERIRTARRYGACFASKLKTVRRFPEVNRPSLPPSSERPAGSATVSDAESRSSRCRLGLAPFAPSDCLLIRSPPNIACEIDSRHASLAVSALLPKTGRRRHDEQTLSRRTRAPTKQLHRSLTSSLSATSCLRKVRAPPVGLATSPARPRAFPWSRTRRADCLFLRAVVGWISLARAGVARRASSTIVFVAPSRGWFLSPPRSVGPSRRGRFAGGDGARSPRRGPIIPRERRLFRSRLVVFVPDRRSGFCQALVAAIENRRA